MIELSRNIVTSANPYISYSLLKNLAKFPQYISGVEQIQSNKIDQNTSHNTWLINMQGTKVKWEEKEVIDDANMYISFKRIKGDFDILEGVKSIKKTKDGTEISVSLKIDWSSNQKINKDLLHRKANLALRWMLRSIRERLDAESIVRFEHIDKLNRTIVSELITYNNLVGKQIVGFFDYLKAAPPPARFIVIPSGYGETKRDSLTLSYYLVSNGFSVVRYDNTDHIGESEGEIFYTTLPKMKDDIIATLNYIQDRFHVNSVGIVATSLAKRVALRAAVEDSRIKLLLGLVGIVDLKATLEAIYCKDIIGTFTAKKDEGFDVAEVLGHEVHRQFPITAINENYHDLKSTREDMKGLKIPVVFIVAEKDIWVRLEDVKMVFETASHPDKELFVMQDTMHLIYENPKAARSVLKQVVISCKKHIARQTYDTAQVIEPGLREIAAQNRIEKARLRRLTEITKESEKEFWRSYLNKYVVITKSKDFRNLLSLIEILLGAPKEGEKILDAGCGNGHFGAWLLWTTAAQFRETNNKKLPIPKRKYVGVDFVQDAIDEAEERHKQIQADILKDLGIPAYNTFINFDYLCLDLEQTLPFSSNDFDKVCCNLVISYVRNPLLVLRELNRILKPGGKIVITSLKPNPDLSYIFRSFAMQGINEDEIKEARLLLSGAGKIKQRESEGHYRFYSERQIKSLFSRAGVFNIKDYRAFADQAVVVAGEKPL